MILSIFIFIIQALRTLHNLSNYILIYRCLWISQAHASLFSFSLCSCTDFFFHFPPMLSSTVSEMSFFPSKFRCMELTLEAPFQQTYASLLFLRAKRFTGEILLPPANYKMELSSLTVHCRPLEQQSWNLFIRSRIFLSRVIFQQVYIYRFNERSLMQCLRKKLGSECKAIWTLTSYCPERNI